MQDTTTSVHDYTYLCLTLVKSTSVANPTYSTNIQKLLSWSKHNKNSWPPPLFFFFGLIILGTIVAFHLTLAGVKVIPSSILTPWTGATLELVFLPERPFFTCQYVKIKFQIRHQLQSGQGTALVEKRYQRKVLTAIFYILEHTNGRYLSLNPTDWKEWVCYRPQMTLQNSLLDKVSFTSIARNPVRGN